MGQAFIGAVYFATADGGGAGANADALRMATATPLGFVALAMAVTVAEMLNNLISRRVQATSGSSR